MNRFTDQKVDIVRLKADVQRGQIITADHLEIVNVGSYNLPNNVIKDGKAVVGKYAATDLYAGDYLFDSKLTLDNKSADDVLLGLDGKKVAISVNISDFAAGLSDKLENGDIVSVIIYDKENNISYTLDRIEAFIKEYQKDCGVSPSYRIVKECEIQGVLVSSIKMY